MTIFMTEIEQDGDVFLRRVGKVPLQEQSKKHLFLEKMASESQQDNIL